MPHLVLFATPGMPGLSIVERYEKALAPVGNIDLVWIPVKGFSKAFAKHAVKFRAAGRIVPNLIKGYSSTPEQPINSLSLITFSAGYGLAREIMRTQADRLALDAYVAIDSIHASLSNGKVPESSVGMFARFARLAKDGDRLFAIGHTDVDTHGHYASTTQAADKIRDLSGGEGGNFLIRSYDEHSADRSEHIASLADWGPEFVREHLTEFLISSRPDTEPSAASVPTAPWLDSCKTLGERCVEFSMAELESGVREIGSSNDSPRLRQYFEPATRVINGKETRLGLKSGNWCAVAACFASQQSVINDDVIPHGYRVSGIELERDAKARGYFRSRDEIMGGNWMARRGDLVILQRGKPGSWTRHVCRIVDPPSPGMYRTVGGNERNGYQLSDRNINDEALIGMIEYPRPERPWVDEKSFSQALRLRDDLWAGNQGLDHAFAMLAEMWDGTG